MKFIAPAPSTLQFSVTLSIILFFKHTSHSCIFTRGVVSSLTAYFPTSQDSHRILRYILQINTLSFILSLRHVCFITQWIGNVFQRSVFLSPSLGFIFLGKKNASSHSRYLEDVRQISWSTIQLSDMGGSHTNVWTLRSEFALVSCFCFCFSFFQTQEHP